MSDATLKLILAWSDRRNLCSTVRDAVAQAVPEGELRRAGDDAIVVFTAESAEALRDRLAGLAEEDEGLLVAEFEKWSSFGKAVDAKWLLARGH